MIPSVRFTTGSRDRGAAIFVVILVITILTAIGAFSARVAGLNQRLTGHARQAKQTSYLAEYVLSVAANEFIENGPKEGLVQVCPANDGILPPEPIFCNKYDTARVGSDLALVGAQLVDPQGQSLGVAQTPLVPGFMVEVVDERLVPTPLAGNSASGQTQETHRYTLFATANVVPTTGALSNTCATPQEVAQFQAQTTSRMRAMVERTK